MPLVAWWATPAVAAPPGTPAAWLDCGHLGDGCLGLSGEFTGGEAAGGSLQISVHDAGTGMWTGVMDACRIRNTDLDDAATARVSCMLDAVGAGMVGPIVWEVTWGTSVLWTSEPLSIACETPDDAPTTTTAAAAEPPDTPPADEATGAVLPPPPPDVAAGDTPPGSAADPPPVIVLETPVAEGGHPDTVTQELPPGTMASSIFGIIEPVVVGTTEPPTTLVSGGGGDAPAAVLPVTGPSAGPLALAGAAMLAAGRALLAAGRKWGRPAG